jgi:glucose/arabinose dehydrogenase
MGAPSLGLTKAVLFFAVLAGALALALSSNASAVTVPAGFQDEGVVTGLDRPTTVAFTPDGRMLIGLEAGIVRVYQNGALVSGAALDISAKVCSDQERGLMSVAVDPAFATNHFIYLYYTLNKVGCEYGSNGSTKLPVNRISRFVLQDDNTVDSASEFPLVDNIPAPEGYHIGADLHFGKDGYLYGSTGDGGCQYSDPVWCNQYNAASRDENVLLGKVLRITRDGAIPPTNPFQGSDSDRCATTGRTTPGRRCQETYSWGLRNPFRLAFDPNTDTTRFFINDVGETTWEEIDQGRAGADYGWNVREGHCATDSQTDCGAPPAGMTNPIFDYPHTTGCAAITGGAFIPDGIWPAAYDSAYLFGDLVCGKMFALTPTRSGGWSQSDFAQGFGAYSIVHMVFGPAGTSQALYYVTDNAPGYEIRRIVYTGAPRGYARPKSATPIHAALVPAFNACGAPNRTHGAPLSYGSCSPPVQSSGTLTVGTPDANGKTANSTSYESLSVLTGNPSTPQDEADVAVRLVATDVRRRSDLSDYTGELRAVTQVRITDKLNGGGGVAGTVVDTPYAMTAPCAATPDMSVGATCSLATTADALVPSTIKEGARAMWQLGQVQVYDGGPDGLASTTAGNTLFMDQGIFVP